MKTKLTIAVIAIFIIGAIWILAAHKGYTDPAVTRGPMGTGTTSAPHETINPNAGGTAYTLADVAKHTNSTSCWTTINGKVYDVTAWISQHPGGAQAILSLCGKDGSSAFNGQHGGQARPEAELATFYIGDLAK